jgi:hypothetical protein
MSRKRSKSDGAGDEDTSSRQTGPRAKLPKTDLPTRLLLEVDPDIELCVDDKVVPGHSQLLSLWSNVLKEAIKTCVSSQDVSATEKAHLSIPMKGTSSSDWLKVVPFMYPRQDEVEVTWDNLEALLVLGDKFDMPGLAYQATKFLDANQANLNINDKDIKNTWKWMLLLDHAAAVNKSLLESFVQRAAVCFRETCTRKNMKCLSRESVEALAAALAGTSKSKMPLQKSLQPSVSAGARMLAAAE